jgi:hypothetical protein
MWTASAQSGRKRTTVTERAGRARGGVVVGCGCEAGRWGKCDARATGGIHQRQ